ncbi:dipeptidase 1 [Procambarus clarkii]|uniref:dipeptidase 1 n=1 Tax=Procambarus clarkii TaxID=6728 RepID=UPI003743F52D
MAVLLYLTQISGVSHCIGTHRYTVVLQFTNSLLCIDSHNDLPWNIRKFMHNKLHSFNFTAHLQTLRPWSRSSWSHTDLPRLRQGMVGAQFWASYVPCEAQRLNAVQLTIEQIDLIKRLIDQYPDDLRLATSADELEKAFKEGRIASLIGVEGGHAIQSSLGVLRALRDLGVRYLTLTHTCSTPWAECARAHETDLEDPDSPRGLTHFGKTVVREMNRLGLMVDLSHVSQATMKAALEVSRAPVIFSHSSVYAICKNPRNVPDDILRKLAMNGGVVMVSFYNHFLTCSETATVKDVVAHINHVRTVAGAHHVGIGADFDGVNKLPEGLEDVSRYPYLFAELLADPSWSLEDLRNLAGHNLLRVMRDVEKVPDVRRLQLLKEAFKQNSVLSFTYEMESDGKLPFLDATVMVRNGDFRTAVYTKETNIGMCLNANSDCPDSSGWKQVDKDLCRVTQVLVNNGFSNGYVEDVIKRKVKRHAISEESTNTTQVRSTMGVQGAAPLEEEVPSAQLATLTNCSYKFIKDADE